jgi:hypothetical protein
MVLLGQETAGRDRGEAKWKDLLFLAPATRAGIPLVNFIEKALKSGQPFS